MAKSKVRRLDSQDQDPTQCHTDKNPWMTNGQGVDPCQLVDQVMYVCAPVPSALGAVQDNFKCPGDPTSSCCCSVATYALMSACWLCQGHHKPSDIDSQIPMYKDFLQSCPDPNNTSSFATGIQAQINTLQVPPWAFIPPQDLSTRWNFTAAQMKGTSPDPTLPSLSPPTLSSVNSISTSSLAAATMASPSASSSPVLSGTSKPSMSPGTIAAAVLGALALTSLLCVGGWLCWRWRRRRMSRPSPGTKVDLTEPEMQEDGRASGSRAIDLASGSTAPPQRTSRFPFPYEGVVTRYHPNARHSYEPSRTDEMTDPAPVPPRLSGSDTRRHTAPTPLSPVDQLDRDLADLTGNAQGQVHHPYIHKTPRRRASLTTFTGGSSNSGSNSSRRARRKSNAEGTGAAQGRYYHLPPSAQYLADVARFPENVDPDRPWNVRRK